VSKRVKSDLYRDLLPLLNSHRVDLLDYPRLVNQLTSLERHVARSGRDTIDHPPRGHDDLANAVAGALLAAHASNRDRIRLGTYHMGYGAPPPAGSNKVGELRHSINNGCIPGPAIVSDTTLQLEAAAFNLRHNIRRPT
jgi:hypothetical protein